MQKDDEDQVDKHLEIAGRWGANPASADLTQLVGDTLSATCQEALRAWSHSRLVGGSEPAYGPYTFLSVDVTGIRRRLDNRSLVYIGIVF